MLLRLTAGAAGLRILAFDCATASCSAAVLAQGRLLAHDCRPLRHGQAAVLPAMLRDAMATAGLAFSDLDAVAVTAGPGGFTGVRIGLAAARAIGLAARLPVVGLSTLECVAAAQKPVATGLCLVALNTRRDDVYVQLFDAAGAPAGEARALMPAEVAAALPPEPLWIAGDAADRLVPALADHAQGATRLCGADLPDAAVVARLAANRLAGLRQAGEADPSSPAPIYLRPPSVRMPLAASRPSPAPQDGNTGGGA